MYIPTVRKTLLSLVLLSGAMPVFAHISEDDSSVFNLDPFVVSTNNVGYQARNSLSATKFDIEVRSVPITVTSLTQEFLEDTYSQTLQDAVRFSSGVTNVARVSAEENDAFYIRGLRTGRSKRNGIIQLFTQDMTNVQKVELVKGPMSLLYGQVEPGGIINYLTLNALPEQRTDIKLIVGNYDHMRFQINHTGPLFDGKADTSGRLLYRFDASYKKDNGYQDNTKDERSFWSGLLEYKPFANTTIEVQWDYLNQNAYNIAPLPKINKQWREIWLDLLEEVPADEHASLRLLSSTDPFSSYAIAEDKFLGIFYQAENTNPDGSAAPRIWDSYAEHWDWTLNMTPTNSFNDVDTHTSSLEVRQKLFDEWFAKLYIVHNDINRESIWGQPWGILISGDAGNGYSSNHWDRYNDDTAYQLEITGKWEMGPSENQTIIGFEYLDNNYKAFLSTDGASNVINPDVYEATVNDPNNPFFSPTVVVTDLSNIFYDKEKFPLEFNQDQDMNSEAAFISNVSRFNNGRFLILGGVRYDKITIGQFITDAETGERELREEAFRESAVSPQIGTSYTISDSLTVYASYSESFVPQSGTVPVLIDDLPPATDENGNQIPYDSRDFTVDVAKHPLWGSGYEFGAKFDAFDDKVSGSMAVFHTELEGTTKLFTVPLEGYLSSISGGVLAPLVGSQVNGRKIDGFETELFLRPVSGLQIVLTYAYIDSIELLAAEVGDIRESQNITLSIPSITVPEHQVGMWTKYDFTKGKLDGFSIGGGFSWLGERFGDYTLRSDNPGAGTGGFRVGPDESVENRILLDDQITWELLLSYEFGSDAVDYTLQVNVKNILDDRFILPGGLPNEPRRIFVTMQAKF
ncbi:MAG: TonB-dependent siderophore receptor [Puniceicoccaceae bacterium]